MRRVIKLTLNILAALTLLVSLVWLVTAPGFEPLLTLLGALGTFLVSFLIKDEIATTFDMPVPRPDLRPALEQQNHQALTTPTAAPLAIPAPVVDFTGREQELHDLAAALANGTGAAITGVRGMGGIGKSQLAYAVAHRLKAPYPKQVMITLLGSTKEPLTPATALQRLIQHFAPTAKLPDDLPSLTAIYQGFLAQHQRETGEAVLILADDAADAAQTRPLLPPDGCALMITSRTHIELEGMVTRNLDTLKPEDAIALLLGIAPRIGDAAPELARLCGFLPLALRVSATFLKRRPAAPIADYLTKLGNERARLSHLHDPKDPMLNVEASFELSYAVLPDAVQQAFQQVSIFVGSFTLAAAEAVVASDNVPDLLDELYLSSLLTFDEATARYSQHDLLRDYGRTRLPAAAERAARLRHARYYADLMDSAQDVYLTGKQLEALAVFDQERQQTDAVWQWLLGQTAGETPPTDAERDQLILDLANATLDTGALRYSTRMERIPQCEAQAAAARRLGDKKAEGTALGNLGTAHRFLGDARQAITYYEQALMISREIGNRHGEGNALGGLGTAHTTLGNAQQAITYYEQRLAIAREIGDRRGEGSALSGLGDAHRDLGDARAAITYYEQRLAIAREIGDRRGEGSAFGGLGTAHRALGDARQAIAYHEQHLAIAREIGNRRGEGYALVNLGTAHRDLGGARRAITYYEKALAVMQEIGDRGGEGYVLGNLGNAHRFLGDARRAITYHEQDLALAREIGDRRGEGYALGGLGDVYKDLLKDYPQAITYYQQALELIRATGDQAGVARNSWNLGVLYEQQGDLAQAAQLMQVAAEFYTAIGHADAEKYADGLARVRGKVSGGGGQVSGG